MTQAERWFMELLIWEDKLEKENRAAEESFQEHLRRKERQKRAIPHVKRVLAVLIEAPNCSMSRTPLLKKVYPDTDAEQLDQALLILEEMEAIRIGKDSQGKRAYQLTKAAIRFFETEKAS